jgi:hypothetical protein
MKVDIDIPIEYALKLLQIYSYKCKEIVVHYNKLDSDTVVELGSYRVKIAYEGEPECLKKEIIMADEIEDMRFEKVVGRLFNKLLMDEIIG